MPGLIAGAVAGSSALGAGSSLLGSGKASSASKAASGQQLQMYYANRDTASPYFNAGNQAIGNALSLAQGGPTGGGPDYLGQAAQNVPPQMTQAQLEQTPGYQFNLSQGLKATQSAAAARGLGVSGASLKGAATYATGLADSTYQNQFNNAQQKFTDYLNLNTGQQTNLQNQFGRLSGIATIGENAAVQTGAQGTQAANAAGNYLSQSGVQQGSGLVNATNALSSGVNNYLGYNALQGYLNAQGTGGTSGYQMTGFAPAMTPGQQGVGGFVAPSG